MDERVLPAEAQLVPVYLSNEVLLSSAISGVRRAAFTCRRPPRFETRTQLRDVLREPGVVETR